MKKYILIILIFTVTTTVFTIKTNAQTSASKTGWKLLFDESMEYYDFMEYNNALRGFKRLLIKDKSNSNINFYIGMCYYYTRKHSKAIIPFLEKATKSVNPAYSYTYRETKAPVFSYFYLGKMYMYNYRFDDAIKAFESFKTYLTDKNRDAKYLIDVELHLNYCKNAIELYANKKDNIKITPLKIINTKYNETHPSYDPMMEILYYSCDKRGSMGGQIAPDTYQPDIYYSKKKGNRWYRPRRLSHRISSATIDNVCSISGSHAYMVFERDKKKNSELWVVKKTEKGKWKGPGILSQNINTNDNETSGYISIDNKSLIFVSDRPGGYGGKDIYMSERLPSGDWGRPFNLGSTVNSAYDEDYPFFLPDGVTLFFSSNGPNSMGGYDVFSSTLSEDGFWSEPENLGYPINTPTDDTHFILLEDRSKGYYSSGKESHKGAYVNDADIYEIEYKK
jgi:tetratricopeptide (TPR) repeat protein